MKEPSHQRNQPAEAAVDESERGADGSPWKRKSECSGELPVVGVAPDRMASRALSRVPSGFLPARIDLPEMTIDEFDRSALPVIFLLKRAPPAGIHIVNPPVDIIG